jgi:bifunctional ADP-heptose synthase (sugar kinase/adenylyltransferase)
MREKTVIKNELTKEKEKLDSKLMKLNNFIRGIDFVKLSDYHKMLLQKQANAMKEYSMTIRDRIVDITNQEQD